MDSRMAWAGAAWRRVVPVLTGMMWLGLCGAAMAQSEPSGPAAGAAQPSSADGVVTEPYIELHSGPGRGYPVFHVVARGERITLLLRHTDWMKVRTDHGVEGWVPRRQLQASLVAAGAPTIDTEVQAAASPYAFEAGGAFGRFKGEPMVKGFLAWRMSPAFSLEGTLGQVQGLFAGTDFWHLGLHTEPWAGQRLSPALGIGFGRLHNVPNASLVAGTGTDAKLANLSLGLRWRLGERLLLRADYTLHTVYLDSRRTGEYRAVSGGLAFPF